MRYDLLAFILLGTQAVSGVEFFQSSDDLPQNVIYDFIIAGGGTGGGVVAARLAENLQWNVLIIEAGPSNLDVFETRVPGLDIDLPGSRVDWNYTVQNPSGETVLYSRAKMLGGCSSHNSMAFTRGSRDDWNKWAEIVEDDTLKWDNMTLFMLKTENLVQNNATEQGHIDPSLYGHDGKISLTSEYIDHPLNDMYLEVTKELPTEYPFLRDMNDGEPVGISWNLFSIDDHKERSSSATAYVETSSNNLHVLLNTYVTRVLPVENGTDFRGVEFAADAQSHRNILFAKKEVIVAGGVIGSPQILLNSGIGNRSELEILGIETLVDNPSVGKNFSDQVYNLGIFNTTLPNSDFDLDTELAKWNASRTGRLTIPGPLLNQVIWMRLPDNSSIFGSDGFTDPSPGPNSPHVEVYTSRISADLPSPFGEVVVPDLNGTVTLQLSIVNLHPISHGSIKLASSDPFADPIIDMNLVSQPLDVAILREAHRRVRQLFTAQAFNGSISGPLYPASNVTTDEEFNEFITSAAGPYLHGGGTARMSPQGATWGVVDPDYRVKGTSGLRIVDASIFPRGPSGHTQAPIYALAERASSMIAQEYTLDGEDGGDS